MVAGAHEEPNEGSCWSARGEPSEVVAGMREEPNKGGCWCV